MEMPFGLYPRFYVKRKEQLFPVIEKYTGTKIAPKTPHGKIIPVYFRLLRTDQAFRAEIDALIAGQESKLLSVKEKVALQKAKSENKGPSVESNLHNTDKAPYQNAGGVLFGSIVDTVGNIFGAAKADKLADAESDKLFYETVLNEQKQDDTIKILVITGITLAFVGLGVYLVLKLRK